MVGSQFRNSDHIAVQRGPCAPNDLDGMWIQVPGTTGGMKCVFVYWLYIQTGQKCGAVRKMFLHGFTPFRSHRNSGPLLETVFSLKKRKIPPSPAWLDIASSQVEELYEAQPLNIIRVSRPSTPNWWSTMARPVARMVGPCRHVVPNPTNIPLVSHQYPMM